MKKSIKLTEAELKRIVRKTINEVAGITSDSRVWTPIVLDLINNDEFDGKKLIINGKNYPEAYEKFPIDKIIINVGGMPHYDEQKSGYDSNSNEYVVYMTIGGSVPFIQHEFKHAFQDIKRHLSKSKPIRQSNFIKNLYTPDFEKFVINVFGGSKDTLELILYYYYITSKVEQDAYLENMYDDVNFAKSVKKQLDGIYNFDFMDNLSDKTWQKMKNSNIPFVNKFKTKEDFAQYSEKRIKNEIEGYKKKIDKMIYLHRKM